MKTRIGVQLGPLGYGEDLMPRGGWLIRIVGSVVLCCG